ncbi:MAG: response regulator [Anaerolineales bacterium]|nr:response regulator [Anaerolineales bacterium]
MKNVWIVDDDKEMANAVSLMLKLLDCKATHFSTPGLAAQELLKGKAPDLIILDIQMGQVSGLDVLEYIRRNRTWNVIPIIMLSSEDADVMKVKAQKLGADGYVTKPVTIEELEKVMAKAFYKHIAKRAN